MKPSIHDFGHGRPCMAKRWKLQSFDPAAATALSKSANVPLVVSQLLLGRGISDPKFVRQFLEARLSGLRDPDQLPGLAMAADLIHSAIQAGDRVTIYGDYDADGMTSTAILLRSAAHAKCRSRFLHSSPHR